MSKTASQFVFKEEYAKWLSNKGIGNSSLGAYCPQDKFECNGKKHLFLDLIGIFAYQEEYFYVSALFEEWKSIIDKKDPKTSLNRYSYLEKYKQFIENKIYGRQNLRNCDKIRIQNIQTCLSSVRDSINKSQNPKVDGMDTLVRYIDAKLFIKLAIESSYFFSPDLVEERFNEIKDYISQQKEVDLAFEKYDITNILTKLNGW